MSLFSSHKPRIFLTIFLLILLIVLSIIFPNGCQKYTKQETKTAPVCEEESTQSNQEQSVPQNINFSNSGKALPIYSVNLKGTELDDGKMYVSLSFDAAWGCSETLKILDILDKYNIKTTFFMTGGWVDEYPDMVKEIYKRGHDLGNHSENHKQMSKLSQASQISEIKNVADKIEDLTGYKSFLFRPPFGDYNNSLIETLYSLNCYPIQWSVDSLDWKDYGEKNIINTILSNKNLKSGAIILMHNGGKYTASALDSLIANLLDKGFTIIPISKLIIHDNFHMDSNGSQTIN